MTEQKEKILQSVTYIKSKLTGDIRIRNAVWTYGDALFPGKYDQTLKIKYSQIPPLNNFSVYADGEVIFARADRKYFIILRGFLDYYKGFTMKECSHMIYVLKLLGVNKLLLVDEVGHLNPRFRTGGISLIYDQINLMGDNPLIGENDNTLGVRFPDMSNCYDIAFYERIASVLRDARLEFYPSVYMGITGPQTETEAECRFYRDAGADVLGYSLAPLVIASAHANLTTAAIGLISRELVADRLQEITDKQRINNRRKAEKVLSDLIHKFL